LACEYTDLGGGNAARRALIHRTPRGRLRVTAPVLFSNERLIPAIADYCQRYRTTPNAYSASGSAHFQNDFSECPTVQMLQRLRKLGEVIGGVDDGLDVMGLHEGKQIAHMLARADGYPI
jgi:DNA-binding transcriptional LysR family regulator